MNKAAGLTPAAFSMPSPLMKAAPADSIESVKTPVEDRVDKSFDYVVSAN